MDLNKPLIYVAGPYAGDVKGNIARAEDVSLYLLRHGWHVITPHKNTAGYEECESDGITSDLWIEMDLNILARCDGIYVMKDWHKSVGTQIEIDFAINNNIPIFWE